MEDALIIVNGPEESSNPARIARGMTPALFGASEQAQRKFWEFFTAHTRNPNLQRHGRLPDSSLLRQRLAAGHTAIVVKILALSCLAERRDRSS